MTRGTGRVACLMLVLVAAGKAWAQEKRVGPEPGGGFVVATGQRIEGGSIAFDGRPIDLALHPEGEVVAVLSKDRVFLVTAGGVVEKSDAALGAHAGFRGLAWSPDGRRLFASTDKGWIACFRLEGRELRPDGTIPVAPEGESGNPVPGGLAITRDGTRLYVASANRGTVVEIDLERDEPIRELEVQRLPFEPRLSDDERTLVVSNWGGRPPREGEPSAKSQDLDVLVDGRGAIASGSVSLVDLASGEARHVEVGLHPTAVVVRGDRAYVANASSDSISEIDVPSATLARTIPMRWGGRRLLGSMPNALAIRDETLYVAGGGDNAVAEVDLPSGEVRGYRHAGFFPVAIALSNDGGSAYVLNTKGNGSVAKTSRGKAGNAHDFQGTVSVLDLSADLKAETERVAKNNRWRDGAARPRSRVYDGTIKHVLYIIKENRTYDEVFGDLPQGNGDASLCSIGETIMPNHRKLAREFTLFDNGYVSGTNSADGHAWSTQAIANEYLEHFYVGYSRTYPDDGDDPMALSNAGAIWDAALAKGRRVRVWGEFCDEKAACVEPRPKDWFEVWEDRERGTGRFRFHAETTVASLKPLVSHEVLYWPLLQSDQGRADVFIRDYEAFSRRGEVPNLMILSLPCDHTEGTNPRYPTPHAMMADNDLALGRVVEAVSKSPQWAETCIFVIEDDAQSGPDHVDGHRTVFLTISPYNRRGNVDSTFYTTTSMIRSIELMLGLDPLNRFDAMAEPIVACFTDHPDLTPYRAEPNRVPLDERNPSGSEMSAEDRFWMEKTLELDWSHIDSPDPYWLNRIVWHSLHRGTRPYPARPGERPGQHDEDDDDEDGR